MCRRFVNKALLMLLIMTTFLVSCVSELPKQEPIAVDEDIQQYTCIPSDDLEELSQGATLDEGLNEEEPLIEESSSAGEEVAEDETATEPLAEPEEIIEEEIIEEPEEITEETIEEEAVMVDSTEEESGMIYMGEYQITAYEWTGNPCANGNYPTPGYTVACNSLPFGTVVYIEGVGYRTVEDRGASWHSDQWIDLYLGDVLECFHWGVQYLDVWVVE